MNSLLRGSVCLVLLISGFTNTAHTVKADLEINNVWTVGMRLPIEIFVQFNAFQILAPELSFGAISDTSMDIDTFLGGVTLSVGAKAYLTRADFSGVFSNGFASGGAMFTPGKSKATALVLAIPYLGGGVDLTFRAFPFFSLIAESRWNFTIPSIGGYVGISFRF